MYITMRDLNGEDWKQIHFKTMKISLIMYSNKMQKGKTVFQLDMFQLKKVILLSRIMELLLGLTVWDSDGKNPIARIFWRICLKSRLMKYRLLLTNR